MAQFTQNVDYTVSNTSYFSSQFYPWDNYIILSTGQYTNVLVKSNDYNVVDNTVTFNNAEVITLTRDSNYSSNYSVSSNDYETVTCTITEPYRVYSNVFPLTNSVDSQYTDTITSMFTAFIAIFIVFYCTIWSLVKRITKRGFRSLKR